MRLGIGDEAHVVTLDMERNIVYMVADPFANPIKEHSWRLVGRGLVRILGMREFRDNMGLIFGGNITPATTYFIPEVGWGSVLAVWIDRQIKGSRDTIDDIDWMGRRAKKHASSNPDSFDLLGGRTECSVVNRNT